MTLASSWVKIRIAYKSFQIVAWTVLLIISIVVFHRVAKVVRSDEAYKPLVRQVTVFIWIYHA